MSNWREIRKAFELIETLLRLSNDKSCHGYIRAKEYLEKYSSYRYSDDFDTVEKWDQKKKTLLKSIRDKNKELEQLRKDNERLEDAIIFTTNKLEKMGAAGREEDGTFTSTSDWKLARQLMDYLSKALEDKENE